MGLIDYLHRDCTTATVRRYMVEIETFLSSVERPENAGYGDIMAHIGKLRKKGVDVAPALYAIKKYHQWLVASGKRRDDPAKGIRLRDKGRKDIQLQDLFTREELERLLDRKERYNMLRYRNLALLSLLIYQGLTNGDIVGLRPMDVDMGNGTLKVRAGRKTDARELKLRARQVFFLMGYINTDRPRMLKRPTDALFINQRGSPETSDGIGYLLSTCRHLFPGRKLNAMTIRQSVIANLLKEGKDLRLVQAFAGHRSPGTTERYRQAHIEELRDGVIRHHPLG